MEMRKKETVMRISSVDFRFSEKTDSTSGVKNDFLAIFRHKGDAGRVSASCSVKPFRKLFQKFFFSFF